MANILETPVTILKITYMNEKFYIVYWLSVQFLLSQHYE